MTVLDYRAADHAYFLDGKQIPGVTRILSDLGGYPGSGFFTENSRQRGHAVHAACHMADVHCANAVTIQDALEVLDIAPAIQPYLAGYLKFRREKRYVATDWETPLFCPKMRVGGIPDSWGKAAADYALVDLKSWASQGSQPKHSAEVQTAGYVSMMRRHLGLPADELIHRWVVKLPGDWNYRCYECTDQTDFSEMSWAAALWWRWKEKGIFKFAGDPEEVLAV